MEKKVTTSIRSALPSIQRELCSDFSFIANKHRQAMKSANELISKLDSDVLTISDSLNCGKLTRLIHFIRNSSAFVLLWVSYTQYALH